MVAYLLGVATGIYLTIRRALRRATTGKDRVYYRRIP